MIAGLNHASIAPHIPDDLKNEASERARSLYNTFTGQGATIDQYMISPFSRSVLNSRFMSDQMLGLPQAAAEMYVQQPDLNHSHNVELSGSIDTDEIQLVGSIPVEHTHYPNLLMKKDRPNYMRLTP